MGGVCNPNHDSLVGVSYPAFKNNVLVFYSQGNTGGQVFRSKLKKYVSVHNEFIFRKVSF